MPDLEPFFQFLGISKQAVGERKDFSAPAMGCFAIPFWSLLRGETPSRLDKDFSRVAVR
jgi:hypothetical protein